MRYLFLLAECRIKAVIFSLILGYEMKIPVLCMPEIRGMPKCS
jgi:hypothetical protein